MNLADAKTEIAAVITWLKSQLADCSAADIRGTLLRDAHRRVARIRKKYKRKIDEKASGWFSIHEISGLERKLSEITEWAEKAIESAARKE